MADYETKLFDGDGTLRPGALPRFQRDGDGGAVGTVSEPDLGRKGLEDLANRP